MPALPTKHYAAELQRQLRGLLGHEQIVTQAYGRHLLIKRLDDEDPTVVARLRAMGHFVYERGTVAEAASIMRVKGGYEGVDDPRGRGGAAVGY